MAKLCKICDNEIIGKYHTAKTCSDECQKEAKRRRSIISCKKYRENNKDKATEYSKAYWAKNRDKLIAKNKKYVLENSDRIKKQTQEKEEVVCKECGKKYTTSKKNNLYKSNKDVCLDCTLPPEKRTKIMASKNKMKNNTTGYIGIFVWKNYKNGKTLGYNSVIKNKRITVMSNKYRDEDLSERTLINAVVDRDVFIIEHNLPHTRNLTDDELFSHISRIYYNDIEKYRNIIYGKKA